MKNVGLIAACDVRGLIGRNNGIPWKNSTDMKRFKELTMGSTLIMGRKTFESLPKKTLPGRTIFVMRRTPSEDQSEIQYYTDIVKAVEAAPTENVWIAGGSQIYKEALGLNLPHFIDLTIINEFILNSTDDKLIYLPPIPYTYQVESEVNNATDPTLWHRRYVVRDAWAWR